MSTDQVAAWADGPEPDAGSIGAVAAVAECLDSGNVISAIIAAPPVADPLKIVGSDLSKDALEKASQQLAANSIAEPFDLVGIGRAAGSASAADVRLVYHFPGSEADAAAAHDSVEHVLREGKPLKGPPVASLLDVVEVQVAGDTVVATLSIPTSGRVDVLANTLINGDVPFVYWQPENDDATGAGTTGG